MFIDKPTSRRFPRVPFERRTYAFLIDFILVWLISSIAGNNWLLELLLFTFAWLVLRVVVVDRNKGQSLGRWALDMRIIDPRSNKTPGIATLAKREGILGLAAFFAMIGLKVNFANPISLFIFISPLFADGATALGDEEYSRTFHDRFSQTLIIGTRRGFSLDLRIKKLINEFKRSRRKYK
jgi:uncharacterized RDD family membrane protein YckC